jgi:ABC-type nitrate/sulfonate/bicarbonate transport system substrate-binding protein
MMPLKFRALAFGLGFLFLSRPLSAGAADKLRVGYVHVFDDAPVVIARDKGFFTSAGLDANVTMFTSGPTLVKGLVSDQLDVGVLGFTNAITWSAQGADLKIVGKVQEGFHSLIARNDRGIKVLKDLKGKSVASQAAGSTADIVLKGVVLKKAGFLRRDDRKVERKMSRSCIPRPRRHWRPSGPAASIRPFSSSPTTPWRARRWR